jgi:Putative amidoligase enzyme
VILLYAHLEKALFALCEDYRLAGHFSQVCGKNYSNMSPDPEAFKRQLMGKFYSDGNPISARPPKDRGQAIKKAQSQKYIGVRYRALNLHSFFLRKSIEFRHHEGSVDANTIINWARVCGHVIEAANRMSEAEIRELPEDSKKALLAILPDDLVEYCKSVWKGKKDNGFDALVEKIKGDLPVVPVEANVDKRTLRRKHRAEKKARARINEFRLAALRAIIQGVPLPDQPQPQPQTQAPPAPAA